MNNRFLVAGVLGIVCLGTLAAVGVQRRELAALHARRAAPSESAQVDQSPPQATATVTSVHCEPLTEREKLERLQLRAEVTQLRQREQQLAGVRENNARLLAKLSSLNLKPETIKVELPQGYVRSSEAKMVGFATPEKAFESFAWAFQRWDTNTLGQACTPEFYSHLSNSEELRENASKVPGFMIRRKTSLADGTVELEVEVVPGTTPEKLRLHLEDGQWKVGD